MNDIEMKNPDPVVSETASESEEDEDVKLTEPSTNAVYNKDGLFDKLGDISWPDNVKWIHKLLIDIDKEQEAEMVKFDAYMEKVKSLLLSTEAKGEDQAELQKKEDVESVKKSRKHRLLSGFEGENKDGDFDLDFENGKAFERSNKKRRGVAPGDRCGGKPKQYNEKKPDPCHSFAHENKDSTNMKNASSSSEIEKKLVKTDEDEASFVSITTVNDEERSLVEEEEAEASFVSITTVNINEEISRDEEEDDDDELRRRIEEFIEKVNKGWRVEKLKTYCLVQ
ncbi:Hypothetical predicted protein [Olea europaea subsp. europaea]|uniref:Uncharacterized protein n=1 Tax=Olea europaea subsp. europaea TaxID=158383 RepID=A0A8S0Q969_OLEEU|nr:Hypothetical predicted protein [Olea europaea subsp. europaea]